MLKHNRIIKHGLLQFLIHPLHKAAHHQQKNDLRRDSLRQQVINFRADVSQVLRRLLLENVQNDFFHERLIFRHGDDRFWPQSTVGLQRYTLEHHDGFSEVAVGGGGDVLGEGGWQVHLLLVCDRLEHFCHLLVRGGGDSDLQTSWSHRHDHSRQWFGVRYNPAIGHVRLHRTTECSLRFLRQIVDFVDYHNFERFLNFCVQLLTSRNLFNQLLHNDPIMRVGFGGRYFQVIVARKDHAVYHCRRGRISAEFFVLRLDFVHVWRFIELVKETLGESALSCTRRAVKQDVGEVLTVRQPR